MRHVRDEDHGLDDAGDGGAGLSENGANIFAALGGLLSDGASNEDTISAERDGTGAENSERSLDSLRLLIGESC